MSAWTFFDYTDGDDTPITSWLADRIQVPIKAKAKIDRVLLQLADTPLWVRPLASNLDGYDGIVEIRIRYMNIQYRLLGFRGPFDRRFTLLFLAREQGDEFIPRNAPAVAVKRMNAVIANPGRAREHRFR
jgi:hypothetical protein